MGLTPPIPPPVSGRPPSLLVNLPPPLSIAPQTADTTFPLGFISPNFAAIPSQSINQVISSGSSSTIPTKSSVSAPIMSTPKHPMSFAFGHQQPWPSTGASENIISNEESSACNSTRDPKGKDLEGSNGNTDNQYKSNTKLCCGNNEKKRSRQHEILNPKKSKIAHSSSDKSVKNKEQVENYEDLPLKSNLSHFFNPLHEERKLSSGKNGSGEVSFSRSNPSNQTSLVKENLRFSQSGPATKPASNEIAGTDSQPFNASSSLPEFGPSSQYFSSPIPDRMSLISSTLSSIAPNIFPFVPPHTMIAPQGVQSPPKLEFSCDTVNRSKEDILSKVKDSEGESIGTKLDLPTTGTYSIHKPVALQPLRHPLTGQTI